MYINRGINFSYDRFNLNVFLSLKINFVLSCKQYRGRIHADEMQHYSSESSLFAKVPVQFCKGLLIKFTFQSCVYLISP